MSARAAARTIAAAALALLAAAAPAGAETYRELVEAYVRRDGAAVDRLASWPRSRLRAELQWLREMRACAHCGERQLADRFPFLGAVLLHTDRAFLDDAAQQLDDRDFHLDYARDLLETSPDAARAFEPHWYLLVGDHYLDTIQMREAHRYFQGGARRFPAEARFAVGDGAAYEQEALLVPPPDVVLSSGERSVGRAFDDASERHHALTLAEAAFRHAAELDPASVEARLRRSHVLLDLGRREEAARDAGWVMEHVPAGGVHTLAALFAGRAAEKAGHGEEAAMLYREAARTAPPAARTPAIALAHALDGLGRTAESRQVVDAVLAHSGDDDPFDLYILGPAGEREGLVAELRAAAGVGGTR